MKTTKILTVSVLAVVVMLYVAKVGNAAEIGTAFTYQGRLIDGNSVADGLYDFQFKLYGDPCVGPLIAGPVNEPVLDVIDGYFTVELDFGSVFDGDGRWLEIGIRDYDPCDVNAFTILIPRQELTPTPYAIYAKIAQTGGSDNDWMVSGNDMYSIPPGNVGIGTLEPASKLHIYSPYDPTVLQIHSSAGFGAGKIEFWSDPQESPNVWRPGSIKSTDNGDYTGGLAFLVNGSGDANKTNETEVMRIVNGAVGIGTTVPSGGTLRVEQGDNPAALLVNTATGADLSVKYGGINEIVSIGSWTVGGIHFYSTCCGYTEPNDGSIQLYPRSGDAVFKGSIGIGTTDPCDETKVHVRTATSDNFGIMVDSQATSGSEIGLHTSSSKYASLAKNAYFDGSWQRFDTSSGAFLQEITPAGDAEFRVAAAGANPISWIDAVTIETSGEVGIGTTDPSDKLEVASLYSNIRLKVSGYTPQIWLRDQGGHEWRTGCHYEDGSLRFSPDNLVGNSKITILQSGNVGIGIGSPGGKLHVSHDGASADFVVDGSSGEVGIGTDDPWSKLHVEGEILVNTSSGSGVHVENVSSHGFHVYNAGNNGLNVYHADGHGVNVLEAINCGIDAIGYKGNHLRSHNSGYYGLYVHSLGDNAGNPGLYVYGNTHITGTINKSACSFKIDHPLEPENKYLCHSVVESPDMKNVYDGVVVLDASGEATVKLPDYFEALNRDFRYQLTCIGGFAPVYISEEISENKFKISGGKSGMKVSWQVSGIRHDPYATAYRIAVEEDKPVEARGYYLYPEGYGHKQDKSIENRHNLESFDIARAQESKVSDGTILF